MLMLNIQQVSRIDEGDGKPGTGIGSTSPRGGLGIGTVLVGRGDQPTDTSTTMLRGFIYNKQHLHN